MTIFNQNINKFKAFTLAEVLITLGIIGVVASFTIPTLLNNIQEAEFKVAYKKAYSEINQNIAKLNSQSLFTPVTSLTGSPEWFDNFVLFSEQFKVNKKCFDDDISECWDQTGEKLEGSTPLNNSPAFIDNSGKAWAMRGSKYGWDSRFWLVDTNGFKKPNKYGKDRFSFFIVLSETTQSGVPVRISIIPSMKDFVNGDTYSYTCPTGPCYYQSWLLK